MLGKSCRSGGLSPSSPCLWSRLRASLLRWLRGRVWAPLDAEDVAGETVSRTLRTFGPASSMAWAQVWSWAVRAARLVLVEAWREASRTEPLERPDEVFFPAAAEATSAPHWLDELAEAATPAQRQVLSLMSQGVTKSQDLAAQLGCSLRVIERHRRGLRTAAESAWNLCRQGRSRLNSNWRPARRGPATTEETTC